MPNGKLNGVKNHVKEDRHGEAGNSEAGDPLNLSGSFSLPFTSLNISLNKACLIFKKTSVLGVDDGSSSSSI